MSYSIPTQKCHCEWSWQKPCPHYKYCLHVRVEGHDNSTQNLSLGNQRSPELSHEIRLEEDSILSFVRGLIPAHHSSRSHCTPQRSWIIVSDWIHRLREYEARVLQLVLESIESQIQAAFDWIPTNLQRRMIGKWIDTTKTPCRCREVRPRCPIESHPAWRHEARSAEMGTWQQRHTTKDIWLAINKNQIKLAL